MSRSWEVHKGLLLWSGWSLIFDLHLIFEFYLTSVQVRSRSPWDCFRTQCAQECFDRRKCNTCYDTMKSIFSAFCYRWDAWFLRWLDYSKIFYHYLLNCYVTHPLIRLVLPYAFDWLSEKMFISLSHLNLSPISSLIYPLFLFFSLPNFDRSHFSFHYREGYNYKFKTKCRELFDKTSEELVFRRRRLL